MKKRVPLFLCAAILAVCLAVPAQSQLGAPSLIGPFYAVAGDMIGTPEETATVAAMGTLVRQGAVARMTVITFRVRAKRVGPIEIGRFDAQQEFDCAAHRWRASTVVVRDMANRFVRSLPGGNEPFRAVDSNGEAGAIALACTGRPGRGMAMAVTVNDIERGMDGYRASRQ